jgi:hypothetical protein
MDYKSQVISIIKYLSIDLNEVVFPIKLEDMEFDSIEWIRPNKIILHKFRDDLDFEWDFDQFDIHTKREIFLFLLRLT